MKQLFLTRMTVIVCLLFTHGFAHAHETGGNTGTGIELIHRIFHALSGHELFYLVVVVFIAVALHGIVRNQRDL